MIAAEQTAVSFQDVASNAGEPGSSTVSVVRVPSSVFGTLEHVDVSVSG